MRIKDFSKKDAIFEATVDLLNEIGFASITMAKVGKAAGVSSSTIYVYFDNKEDMLKKIYIDVKQKLSQAISRGIHENLPSRDMVERLVRNALSFVQNNKSYFLFIEQFSNSPLVEACSGDLEGMFDPLFTAFEAGIKRGELKQAEIVFLITYCYQPISAIAKEIARRNILLEDDQLGQIIQMSWDAVRA